MIKNQIINQLTFMKKINYFLCLFLPVFLGLLSCEEESAGKLEPGDPTLIPTGVVTGNVIDNLGTSAIISLTVGSDGGGFLLSNGIIASTASNLTIETPGVVIGADAAKVATTGELQVTVSGLTKSTIYYFRAFSYNSNGIAYGDIKSFETSNVTFTPYRTQFRPNVAADIADWVFDKYTGFDESGADLVWFDSQIGTTSAACYWDGDDLTVISPLIRVANEADTLRFTGYFGAFGSPEITVKLYITEDLENYGEPARTYNFTTYTAGGVRVPMAAYLGRSIYVIFVVERGDFILANFSIAPTAS
jgi:hypothetical protein